MRSLTLFHGTDLKHTLSIKENGFRIKPSVRHWLGQGVYFFTDKSLAKWWTAGPHGEFGSLVETPAIITCTLPSDAQILDLRKLEDYFFFVKVFEKEFWPLFARHAVSNKAYDVKKVRCAYCNYLQAVYSYDAIIGNFIIPDQPYQPHTTNNVLKQLMLEYTEIQVCVFDAKIIDIIEVEEINNEERR